MSPRISVVMSVFNSGRYLEESVQSILTQTETDFEFIIVNDGSTDGSGEQLRKFAEADRRVRLIEQENTGLTKALIVGCAAAQGKLIARQDDDDRSHPDRLRRQAEYLDAHPEVGFVGCTTRYMGPDGELLEQITRDSDPAEATRRLREERCGPPAHGGVMFRRDIYQQAGGYRPEFYLGQDSDLWLRMVEHTQFCCLPDELYFFRRHSRSVSSRHREHQSALGWLSQDCRKARREGRSEAQYLQQAADISARVRDERSRDGRDAVDLELNYLIGSRLAQAGQPEAFKYLWPVALRQPWHWKAWARLLEAYSRKWLQRKASHG